MSDSVLYISECPVCQQGLVRIRAVVSKQFLRSVCQCDECDAAWSDPQLTDRLMREHVEQLHSSCESWYWASREEACLLGWAGSLIFVNESR
ncbi:hypothetical protein SH449x_000850 [Pirellulaceae bacterium SH449]